MKKINYLLLKICLLFWALCPATTLVAQSTSIYEVSSLFPENAIVRYWKESLYIVCVDKGTYDAYFALVDIPAMTYHEVMLRECEISDFEIEDGKVYFCGKKKTSGGNSPVFGYYNISTFFTTGTGAYITTAPFTTVYASQEFAGETERIISLMNLEVQSCTDGLHVYMVGESVCSCYPSATNRCIVDLWHVPALNYWGGAFAQENGSIYYYDDIAVSDTNVVVAGHKNGSCGQYITIYTKPISAYYHLIYSPSIAAYYNAGGGGDYWLDPNRPTMIEYMFDDLCAIVGYGDLLLNNSMDRGTVITIINGNNNCVYRYCIPQGYSDTAQWKIKDFRYNKDTKRLYLLQEMSRPVTVGLNSVLCVFDVDPTGKLTSATAYYEEDMEYFSLDQAANYWESVLVGRDASLRLWNHVSVSDCVSRATLLLKSLDKVHYPMGYRQYPIDMEIDMYSESGLLMDYGIEEECNDNNINN